MIVWLHVWLPHIRPQPGPPIRRLPEEHKEATTPDRPTAGSSRQKGINNMSERLDAYKTTGASPPLRVTVTHVQMTPGSTVALGEGLDSCGRAISFAGDWRHMLAITEALDAGEEVQLCL